MRGEITFGASETSRSTALGDAAGAIVRETSDVVGAPLGRLNPPLEALGAAVGFGKSPHGSDLDQSGAEGEARVCRAANWLCSRSSRKRSRKRWSGWSRRRMGTSRLGS